MATFLNVGVLGQQVGGTLGTGALRGEFTSFRDRVLAGKRAPGARKRRRTQLGKEAEAVRGTRAEAIAQSKETTGIEEGVLTSDIKPTNLVGDTAEQQAITASLGITKQTQTATKTEVAPESKFTSAEGAFVTQLQNWAAHIGSKPSNDINRGRRDTQGNLQRLVEAAGATGNQNLVEAVGGIQGILNQSNISARNVGQAKATTLAAQAAVRKQLDIERIQKLMSEGQLATDAGKTTSRRKSTGIIGRGLKTALGVTRGSSRRGFGGFTADTNTR